MYLLKKRGIFVLNTSQTKESGDIFEMFKNRDRMGTHYSEGGSLSVMYIYPSII